MDKRNGVAEGTPAAEPRAGDLASSGMPLYLELELNSVPLKRLGYFLERGGRLYATVQTLDELGVDWRPATQTQAPPVPPPPDTLVALDALRGVRYRYDAADQRLALDVPPALLTTAPARIGTRAPAPPRIDPATRAPGLLLNYTLWAQGQDGDYGVSSFQELRLFGAGPGIWRTSSNLSAYDDRGQADGRWGSVRLETAWQLDFPEPMVSLVAGDTFTRSLEWTRSLRFGGVRVSRNFELQPYRVTVPLATFAGEAALPSTVDLYIDGLRQVREEVLPGRFRVEAVPSISGLGTARVVVSDINGRSQVVEFPIYSDRNLLQRGLSSWSLEAGHLRREYGRRSFEYAGRPMASASVRRGMTDYLTLEAHGEGMDGLQMAGVGALLRLGTVGGVLSASWARSRHDVSGHMHGWGYDWQNRYFTLSLATLRRDAAFADVASHDSGSALPLRSERAFAGLSLGVGHVGVGYVRQEFPGELAERYVSLSGSRRLSERVHFNLSLSRDLGGETGTTAFAYVFIALDRHRHAWASVERVDGAGALVVGAARALPVQQDGWGWRMEAAAGENRRLQARLSRATGYGHWELGALVQRQQGFEQTIGYAELNGGLLWMQGALLPMRRVYDAFALVSTDGIAGVPVELENRPVGATDRRGLLLVTPLRAWENNQLSIDPLGLPADVSVPVTRINAVPSTGAGTLARFPLRVRLMVVAALRTADGEPVPAGSGVELVARDGRATPASPVGYGGEAYLEDPPAGARLRVLTHDRACTVQLPDSLPPRGWVNLGELPCR